MSQIISVALVNVDTGTEEILHRVRDSRCHFIDWFCYKNFEVQLRLDYNGNPNEAPTIDADIKDAGTGRLLKKGPWHHTGVKHDDASNKHVYTFKFDSLILRFYTTTTAGSDQAFTVMPR